MQTFSGVRESLWYLYKKPGRTGIETLERPLEKAISVLSNAVSSKTLCPEARAVRKSVIEIGWEGLFRGH